MYTEESICVFRHLKGFDDELKRKTSTQIPYLNQTKRNATSRKKFSTLTYKKKTVLVGAFTDEVKKKKKKLINK